MTTLAPSKTSIPGPPSTPLLGWRANAWQFYRDPLNYMTRLRQEYGDVVALVQGGNPAIITGESDCAGTVFAFGPEYNREIFTNTEAFHSFPVVGPLYPPEEAGGRRAVLRNLGSGLFKVNGEEHRQQRRLLMPAFHKTHIESYRDDMVALTERMLESWQPDQTRDINRDMMQLTLGIAGQTLFGLDFGREGVNFGKTIQEWLKMVVLAQVDLFQHDWPLTPYRRFLKTSVQLDSTIRALIARKRRLASESKDVLSSLIAARDEEGASLSEDELVGHANILLLAGHETSSNALTWTLFLLSQHPVVLADLLDELDGKLHGQPPTVEQLAGLPLLEGVIKESMRLLPPIPMSARLVVQPVELGPYELLPGSEVVFSHYHTHHSPQLYQQPQKFWPGRWASINPSPHEYLPFSAGKRMCIGFSFAMMEIKLILATLLQRFRLQLVPNARVDYYVGVALTPRRGMPMLVERAGHPIQKSPLRVGGNIHELVDLPL